MNGKRKVTLRRNRKPQPYSAPRAIVSQLKKEPNELKRKLLLVGYLTERLSKDGESLFLVGGQAVETYTAGQFTTGDIDVTTSDRGATEKVLTQMGFVEEGMVWLNKVLGLTVHIVCTYPTRSERVRRIEVGRYEVSVVGIEDLIIDRLAAAKHWRSERDAEQAGVLFNGFRRSIDLEYLRERAKEEKLEEMLPEGARFG